jgi:hypothetical protein
MRIEQTRQVEMVEVERMLCVDCGCSVVVGSTCPACARRAEIDDGHEIVEADRADMW